MPHRPKILILENDDFLRELIGNLLHKKDQFILNGSTIQQGLKAAQNQHIDTVILGTSCPDFNNKSSINYIKQQLHPQVRLFSINHSNKKMTYIENNDQMMIKDLSIKNLIQTILG